MQDRPSTLTLPEGDTPSEISVAASILPWRKDDNRSRFLSYMACGFSTDEALYMLGLNRTWLEEQRKDTNFYSYELRVPEIRKELSREYIELDFNRNFRLVLEKDYQILRKSLGMDKDQEGNPVPMSNQDHQYLLKMRTAYTPQQLQILQQVMSGANSAGDFNFAQWVAKNQEVIEMSRTDTIRLKSGGNGNGET